MKEIYHMKFRVTGRVWIETEQGTFAGLGRITLLERIKKHGSITVAARSMKMSYRQAWELIDSMNKKSEKPLVKKVSGGAGGGGSVLTEEGERLINEYWKIHSDFLQFNEMETQKLTL